MQTAIRFIAAAASLAILLTVAWLAINGVPANAQAPQNEGDDGSVEYCSDEQVREDPLECPGFWAAYSEPGQAEPDTPTAPDPPPVQERHSGGQLATDEDDRYPWTAGSVPGTSQTCNYSTVGDNPHKSNNPPGDVSVHGW